MCADPRVVVEKIGRHVGPEARIFEDARLAEKPEELDPEREKQVRTDEAALEAWLRSRGGQPWFDEIVMECIERFPRLDRFQVSAVIYKLREEASALDKRAAAEQSIKEHGFDIDELSEEEVTEFLKANLSGPEAVTAVRERLKRRHGNQQGDKKEEGAPRTDAEAGEARKGIADCA